MVLLGVYFVCIWFCAPRVPKRQVYEHSKLFKHTTPQKICEKKWKWCWKSERKGKEKQFEHYLWRYFAFFLLYLEKKENVPLVDGAVVIRRHNKKRKKTFHPFMKSLAFTYSSTNNSSLTRPYIREKSLSGRFWWLVVMGWPREAIKTYESNT